jgi:hypothetical protein
MTDIIKNVEIVRSAELLRHLRECPSVVRRSVKVFREELKDLGAVKPTLLAFGFEAHALIARNIPACQYSRLIRLTHYSHRIGKSKEKFRETVLAQIGSCATVGPRVTA